MTENKSQIEVVAEAVRQWRSDDKSPIGRFEIKGVPVEIAKVAGEEAMIDFSTVQFEGELERMESCYGDVTMEMSRIKPPVPELYDVVLIRNQG